MESQQQPHEDSVAVFLMSDDAAVNKLAAERLISPNESVVTSCINPKEEKEEEESGGNGIRRDTVNAIEGLSILNADLRSSGGAAALITRSPAGAIEARRTFSVSGMVPNPHSPIQAEPNPIGSGEFWSHSTQGIVAATSLSADMCKNEIQMLEAEIEAERKAREDELEELERQKEIKRQISEEEANEALIKFTTQDTFRWSVPNGSEHYSVYPSALEEGNRVRPEVPPALPHDLPAVPASSLPLVEQEQQLGERHSALLVKHSEMAARRKAQEFDMQEALFLDAVSSDDSEGFDEDLEAEWREETSRIHSICKAYEVDFSNDVAATNFRNLLLELGKKSHEDINFAERSLLWDTLRLCHRAAQPLHHKHWLSACHEIIDGGGHFGRRPSVADYSCIMHTALHLTVLTERQYEKVKRWANRSTYLVRKRVLALQEFGVEEPTWEQVNASVAGLGRKDAKVPTLTLHDTLVSLTAKSRQKEVDNSPMKEKLRLEAAAAGAGLHGDSDETPTTSASDVNLAAARGGRSDLSVAAVETLSGGDVVKAPPVMDDPVVIFHS